MITEPNAALFRAYAHTHQCSLQEAKRALRKEWLLHLVDSAKTFNDFRPVLRAIIVRSM